MESHKQWDAAAVIGLNIVTFTVVILLIYCCLVSPANIYPCFTGNYIVIICEFLFLAGASPTVCKTKPRHSNSLQWQRNGPKLSALQKYYIPGLGPQPTSEHRYDALSHGHQTLPLFELRLLSLWLYILSNVNMNVL